MHVTVVGAGVVGLSCAVRLLEAGHRVEILARELPQQTTSALAAAIWRPYLALPQDRVTGWGARAFEVFTELAHAEPNSGVRLLPGSEVYTVLTPDPWWVSAVPGLTRLRELPEGYVDGWEIVLPVVSMPTYLDWLTGRVRALGGALRRTDLAALPEPAAAAGVVVDCSGLGARRLVPDEETVPVRGQVVYVEQWGLERWSLDEAGPTYVVPRLDEVVVGGTEEPGEWDPTPSPETARNILERAARLVPELAGARILRHRAGLRPSRPVVRVERVGAVVHCYGHGGAGVTLSWGCADEVVALVEGG